MGADGSPVSVPWLSYLPLPGLALVATWADPDDPLTRYHAWQGGTLVILAYAWIVVLGFLLGASDAAAFQATIGLASGLGVIAALIGMVWGIVAAARKRYTRIRPVWDLLTVLRRA